MQVDGYALFAGGTRERIGVVGGGLVFSDLHQHAGQTVQVGIGGGEVRQVRVGLAAVGRSAPDLPFMRGEALRPREGIERVAVAVSPVRVAGGGQIEEGGDADDRLRQPQPHLPRAQAGGKQQIGAEAVADGRERPPFRQAARERAIGAEALVVHGGVHEVFARRIVDAVHAAAHLRIAFGGAAVKIVHARRVSAAVEVDELPLVCGRL